MELMDKTDAKASVARPLRHCPTETPAISMRAPQSYMYSSHSSTHFDNHR